MAPRDHSSSEPSRPEGWLFVRAGSIPERFRDRAVEVFLVPLLPGEIAQLLEAQKAVADPVIDAEDPRLLALVAQGRSASAISGELELHPRTVQRRLARLRRRLGVNTTAEVAALLARAGFTRDQGT